VSKREREEDTTVRCGGEGEEEQAKMQRVRQLVEDWANVKAKKIQRRRA